MSQNEKGVVHNEKHKNHAIVWASFPWWRAARRKQQYHKPKETAWRGVWDFFCKLDFSMTKYLFLVGRIAEFRPSCLSCNIVRILRHVKGGLTRDREFHPCTWWKICAKKAARHTWSTTPRKLYPNFWAALSISLLPQMSPNTVPSKVPCHLGIHSSGCLTDAKHCWGFLLHWLCT